MREDATGLRADAADGAVQASAQAAVEPRAVLAMVCAWVGLLGLPLGLPVGSPWVALAVQLVVAALLPIWLGLAARDRILDSAGHLYGADFALAAAVIGAVNIPVTIVLVVLYAASPLFGLFWLSSALQ
jgi:hypothetical protein